MSNNLKRNSNWTLITIDDPSFLSGQSIYNIFHLILRIIEFKFVILNEIYGVTELIAFLEKKENTVMKIQDLLEIICKVKQFDWGDFFLFKEYPDKWENIDDIIYYPNLVNQSDTTIRAVDDQYIYVYTPYQEIVNVIKDNYDIESIKTDSLDNLDYPY